jgi:hypothetical protein
MADQDDAENPQYAPKQIVEEKLPVVHRRHSGHERRKSANHRKVSRQRYGLASVPLVKGMSLIQVFSIENPGIVALEKLSSESRTNPIIEGIAQKSGDREQDQDHVKLKVLGRSG